MMNLCQKIGAFYRIQIATPHHMMLVLNAGDAPVNVSLVDKRGEDYEKPPEPSYVAYSGAGQTVG